jgi:hypothetical protein
MGDLISEAAQMPDAAVRFARGVDRVWTPEHLVPLRTIVRQRHGAQLRAFHHLTGSTIMPSTAWCCGRGRW